MKLISVFILDMRLAIFFAGLSLVLLPVVFVVGFLDCVVLVEPAIEVAFVLVDVETETELEFADDEIAGDFVSVAADV